MSKNTGKKVGFAAVFPDTTRRGPLPEEASIYYVKSLHAQDLEEVKKQISSKTSNSYAKNDQNSLEKKSGKAFSKQLIQKN